jgi:hypothetical protein
LEKILNFKELLEQCESILEPDGEYDSELVFISSKKLELYAIVGTIVIDFNNETIELIPR